MRIGGLFTGGLVLGALYYFARSASKLNNLEINLSGLKLDSNKTNLSESVLNATLSIYNPNTQDVKFSSFVGNVFSGSTRIGNIDTKTASGTSLSGRATTKIPVTLSIANSNILQQVASTLSVLLFGGEKKATLPEEFNLLGTLKAENLPAIPISQKIKLSA